MSLSITFRTTDNAKWGAGNGADLSASQVDNNFWVIKEAVEQLQLDMPAAVVGIDTFSTSNTGFYVHLTDGSTQGPYDLPVTTWNFQGTWAASTAYFVNDVVTSGFGIYLVIYEHTSDVAFDPGENDGLGNDYYQLIMTLEPFAVPAGGTTGQALVKASNADNDTTWYTIPEPIVPPGDNTMNVTYTGSELAVDGDFATDPSLASPSVTLNQHSWSAGQITYTLLLGGDGSVDIPINGMTIGNYYLFSFTGTITDDLNVIYAGVANLDYALFGGSGAFVFQAASNNDVITFDFLNYVIGATRTMTSFSCRQIDQPELVNMSNSINKTMEMGAGSGNIFMGERAGAAAPVFGTGSYTYSNTIAIGVAALENAITSRNNIAIGAGALKEGSPQFSIAIGIGTLMNNTGSYNVAIGQSSMAKAGTASNNVVIGTGATAGSNGGSNVYIGSLDTADRNSSGVFNIAIGDAAFGTATDGSSNVVVGASAGVNIGMDGTPVNYNTLIGHGADGYYADTQNSIAVGYNAKVTSSNAVQLGNASVLKAYIGNKAVGLPKHLLVAGTTPGNVTVTGINVGDRVDEVIYYPAAGGVFDLTSEFGANVPSTNTINNSVGTDSTGGKLLVRWTSLT